MNREQRKHLRGRLTQARSNLNSKIWDTSIPVSAEVKKARRVIEAHSAALERAKSSRRSKMEKAFAIAEESLVFGDDKKALAAVEKFEQLKI